jgi:hypothetical protein
MKAYSGLLSLGHMPTLGDDSVNSAVLISMWLKETIKGRFAC